MSEDIRLMAQIEDLPTLDQKFALFVDYLKSEHHYDAVTYVICLDNRSTEHILHSTIMKEHGLQPEWMKQYIDEQLALADISIPMVGTMTSSILQSRIYNAVDQGKIAPRFHAVPNRVRDYVKSGVAVPVFNQNLRGGFGLHSRSMTTDQHDARFAKNGWLIETMCQHFHHASRWADEIITHTQLTDLNLLVLRLKAQGKAVKEILHVIGRNNDKTITHHMNRVCAKLGVKTPAEAIAKASVLGLLDGPDEPSKDQLRDSFEDWLE